MEVVVRPHIMSDRQLAVQDINYGITVQELVDSLSGIDARVREMNLCVLIDGHVISRSQWKYRRLEKTDKRVSVSAVLHGGGGNDSGGKQILSLIAVIILSVIAGPIASGLTGGLTSGTTFLMVKAGVMLVGTMLINAIFAPPKAKKQEDSGGNAYTFGSQANLARHFGPIPRVYGKHRISPDLAAVPYTLNVGEDTYFYAVYSFGYGPLALEDFKIGQNPITNYKDYDLVVHENFTSSSQLQLYRSDVWQDGYQAEITFASPVTVTTRPGTDAGVLDIVFPTGLGFANETGEMERRTAEMEVEYRVSGSGSGWTPLPLTNVSRGTSLGNGVVILQATEESNPDIPSAGSWFTIVRGTTNFDVIEWVDGIPDPGAPFVIANCIMTVASATATTLVTTTGLPGTLFGGSDGRLLGRYTPPGVTPGAWFFSEITQRMFTAGASFSFPSAGTWDVRIRNLDADYDPEDMKHLWRRNVTALKSLKNVPPIEPDVLLTVAELRIKATGQLNTSVENFSAMATSKLWQYVSGEWVVAETRNPAWIYRDILMGTANRRPVDTSRVDHATLIAWAAKNDTITAPFTEVLGTCDIVIDKTYTVWELLQSVSTCGRAAPTMKDNKYSVIIDDATRTPIQVFTPRNSSGLRSTRTYVEEPHALRVKWVDPLAGYNPAEAIVYNDGYTEANATMFEELVSFGMTRHEQVIRWGRYMLAQGKLRQERFSIDTDIENIVCVRGDLVLVAHDVIQVGGEACRIASVDGNTLYLDAPPTVGTYAPEIPVGIRVRKADGTITSVLTVTARGEDPELGDYVTVGTGLPAGLAEGDLLVFGALSTVTGEYVVDSIRPDSDLGATILLEEYAPSVYTAESTGVIPDYVPQPGSIFIPQLPSNFTGIVAESTDEYGNNPYGQVILTWNPSQDVPYQPERYRLWLVDVAGEVYLGETTATTFTDPTQYPLWVVGVGGETKYYRIHADYGRRGISFSTQCSVVLPLRERVAPPNVDQFDVEETESGTRRYILGFNVILDTQRVAGTYVRYVAGTVLPEDIVWATMTPVLDGGQYFTQSGVELAVPLDPGTYTFAARTVDYVGTLAVTPVVITRTFTLSGAASFVERLELSAVGNGFVFDTADSSSSDSPTITFTATLENLTGTATFEAIAYDTAGAVLGAPLTMGGTGNVRTLSAAQFNANGSPTTRYVVVTASIVGTTGTFTDAATVYRLDNGSNAITVLLPNASHTVPASSAGAVSSYAGSGSTLQAFEGSTALTFHTTLAAGRFTVGTPVVAPVGDITVGARSGSGTTTCTIAVHSAMDAATDSVTITYPITVRRLDGTDISVSAVQTITKSKAGAGGTDATAYWMSGSAGAVQRNAAGTLYTPATVTFSGFSASGAGAPAAYAGRFIIATSTDGSIYTTQYTSAGNESSKTYTVPLGIVAIRARLYLAGGTTTLLDEVVTPIVVDGTHALTPIVSNSSHTVPASSAGVVSSYTGSGTTLQVYEGGSVLTYATTLSAASQFTIGTPVVSPVGDITVGARSGNGLTTATVAAHSAMDDATDSVTITYPITVRRADGTDTSFNVVQTITKSKAGATGGAGANAKTVRLLADSFMFVEDTAGALGPDYITLTVNKQNTTGAVTWSASPVVTFYTASTGGIATTTGDTVYLRKADYGSNTKVTITASITDGTTFTDSAAIVRVTDGSNALTPIMDNGSHTVPADSSGAVSSYTGSGTTIKVLEGSTALTFHTTLAAGRFVVGTPTVSPVGDITVGARSGSGTDTCTVAAHSAMDSATDSVTITYPITARRADGTDVSFSLTQTITKSKEGVGGTAAKTVRLVAAGQIFTENAAGALSPATIQLGTSKQNTTGTVNWSTSPAVNLYAATSGGVPVTTGDTLYIRQADFGSNTSVEITASITDGSTFSDRVTVVRVIDGTNAITPLMNNGSHLLPASNAGVVSSYAGSGTTIQVLEGSTFLTFHTTLDVGRFTIGTPVVSPVGDITVGARSGSGTTTATVADHSAMDDATDVVTVTYPITARRADGTDVSFNLVQTLAKSKVGAAGTRTATLRLYQWAASAPTAASGTSVYTWATAGFTTGSLTLGSWATSPGAPADGQTLYVNEKIITDSTTDATTAVTWSGTTVSAIGKSIAGNAGARGSLEGYGYEFGIVSTSWSDAKANRVIHNILNGAALTTDLATTTHLQLGDRVTLSNNSTWAGTKYWNGTAWTDAGLVVDGNAIVTGTFSASKITTGTMSADRITAGTIAGLGGGSVEFNSAAGQPYVSFTRGSGTIGYGVSFYDAQNITYPHVGFQKVHGSGANVAISTGTSATGESLTIVHSSGNAIAVDFDRTAGTGVGVSITHNSSATGTPLEVRNATSGTLTALFQNTGATKTFSICGSAYAAYSAAGEGEWFCDDGVFSFTGAHVGLILNEAEWVEGDIVVDTAVVSRRSVSSVITTVGLSSEARQRTALGVITKDMGHDAYPLDYKLWWEYAPSYRMVGVNGVGEGQINVCGEGGDIEAGDFICISSVQGKGMRQTDPNDPGQPDDLHRRCTVARAREDVRFDYPGQVKLVACVYLCG